MLERSLCVHCKWTGMEILNFKILSLEACKTSKVKSVRCDRSRWFTIYHNLLIWMIWTFSWFSLPDPPAITLELFGSKPCQTIQLRHAKSDLVMFGITFPQHPHPVTAPPSSKWSGAIHPRIQPAAPALVVPSHLPARGGGSPTGSPSTCVDVAMSISGVVLREDL
jgi:hypothetical protein